MQNSHYLVSKRVCELLKVWPIKINWIESNTVPIHAFDSKHLANEILFSHILSYYAPLCFNVMLVLVKWVDTGLHEFLAYVCKISAVNSLLSIRSGTDIQIICLNTIENSWAKCLTKILKIAEFLALLQYTIM